MLPGPIVRGIPRMAMSASHDQRFAAGRLSQKSPAFEVQVVPQPHLAAMKLLLVISVPSSVGVSRLVGLGPSGVLVPVRDPSSELPVGLGALWPCSFPLKTPLGTHHLAVGGPAQKPLPGLQSPNPSPRCGWKPGTTRAGALHAGLVTGGLS